MPNFNKVHYNNAQLCVIDERHRSTSTTECTKQTADKTNDRGT